MLKTPIVLIIFNRPECVRRVLDTISLEKPSQLFIVADGPREGNHSDVEKCAAARKVVTDWEIDWECDIKTKFSDINLGCAKGPASGIDWAFESVEEVIILEDDCIPNRSFFQFCESMLERYRHDDRIMNISGSTNRTDSIDTPYSYCYSNFPSIWGWATWKRAWSRFDIAVKAWPELKKTSWIEEKLKFDFLSNYFRDEFDLAYEKEGDTGVWDHQWNFSIWSNNGICIFPKHNLVSNIGFGPDGTHTFREDDFLASKPTVELDFPLNHPPEVVIDEQRDDLYVDEVYKRQLVKPKRSFTQRVKGRLRQLFR